MPGWASGVSWSPVCVLERSQVGSSTAFLYIYLNPPRRATPSLLHSPCVPSPRPDAQRLPSFKSLAPYPKRRLSCALSRPSLAALLPPSTYLFPAVPSDSDSSDPQVRTCTAQFCCDTAVVGHGCAHCQHSSSKRGTSRLHISPPPPTANSGARFPAVSASVCYHCDACMHMHM